MFGRTLLVFLMLAGSLGTASGQADKKLGAAHSVYICGLSIGMTPQQVLDAMKRPPDVGEVQGDDIVSGWQLPGGDFLSVRFHQKQFVSYLTLDYHPVRERRDLWLPTEYEHTRISIVPERTNTPGIQFEYEMDETQNGERVVWYRRQKEPRGYDIEIGFQSSSRLKVGERDYKNQVTAKYVAVRKAELPRFEKAMMASPNPPGVNAGTKPDAEKKKQ
jgi:hypothetical protein